MSFTKEQVEEALVLATLDYAWHENDDEDSEVVWNEVPEVLYGGEKTYNGMTIKLVEDFGGGEGEGETRYLVLEVREEGSGVHAERQYFRKDGYYASYYGTEWDGDFREVNAIQRTVTFYE